MVIALCAGGHQIETGRGKFHFARFTEAGRGTQCPNPLPKGGVWGTKGSPFNRHGAAEARGAHNPEDT